MAPESSSPAETSAGSPPGAPVARYDAALAAEVERRWQDRWDELDVYATPTRPAVDDGRTSFVMDMFPYPSGAGLHVGHPLGYIATDVHSRYLRMSGRRVLHTLGYDAFGLPAEQYAVQTGTHPRTSTLANIATMRAQLRRLGLGHDPHRSVSTIDPAYYRWTQWIFLQVFDSWYDPEAPARSGTGRGRARPVSELVASFADGSRATPDGRSWADLSPAERDAVLQTYRLAYVDEAPVNWCPGLGTVLANEEVTADGRSERGNFPVFTASLRQWKMRITAYADRLLDDLAPLDWPEAIKIQQRHWIGRSEGAHVRFAVAGGEGAGGGTVEVFTTRPDTLFGATYVVLAPEHPLVGTVLPDAWPATAPGGGPLPEAWTGGAATPREAVQEYARRAAARSDVERQEESRTKTGVFTGATATNPATGEQVPVFVADYVLMGYGTGAIMAVPAHDQRDLDFARALSLPLRGVVAPTDGRGDDAASWDDAWTAKDGTVVASDASARGGAVLDGLGVAEAGERMTAWLAEHDLGRPTTTYRLRDWLFSRQRYWGEPFPVVYDADGVAHALPESMLPVELPEVDDYSPRTFDPDDADTSPETPLSRREDWVEVELDLGDGPRTYRRETNTMPNWAGSCWYELRYLDPDNAERLVDPDVEREWMGPREGKPLGGVDLYVGGAEHAVLHLLYARFWHKVLHDLGHVSSAEPFHRLFNQGMIQAYVFRDARGIAVPAVEVEEQGADGTPGATTYTWQGQPVTRELGKMGKSLRNAVAPDEIAAEYGADTLRLYEMGMGPLDAARPWETRAVVGSFRFLQRLWRNVVDEQTGGLAVTDEPADDATARLVARTVDGVRRDYEALRFNTALAKVIELNNHLVKRGSTPRAVAEQLVLLVAPLAPHVAEELWERLGHGTSLVHEAFPEVDPALLVEDEVTAVVQVRGKVRARLQVPAGIGEDELRERALADPAVQRVVGDAEVRKVVVRPPTLVNVVV